MTEIPADIMEKAEAVQRASLGRGIRQSIELIAKAIAEERKATEKAKADADLCAKEWEAALKENLVRRAQLREAVEALSFYAKPGDYAAPRTGFVAGDENKLYFDCGNRAREALAKMAKKAGAP